MSWWPTYLPTYLPTHFRGRRPCVFVSIRKGMVGLAKEDVRLFFSSSSASVSLTLTI